MTTQTRMVTLAAASAAAGSLLATLALNYRDWTEIANTILKLAQVVGNMVIGGKTGKVIREYTEKRMNQTPPMNSTTVTQRYDPEMQFKGMDKTVTTKW